MTKKMLLITVIGIALIFSMSAEASEMWKELDGYYWEELSRKQKTGVLIGLSHAIVFYEEFLEFESGLEAAYSEEVAYRTSYFIDELYENNPNEIILAELIANITEAN